jgi:hypothetical protein
MHIPEMTMQSFNARFTDAVDDGLVDDIMNTIKPFHASIPYDLVVDKDIYYATAVHLIFRMAGIQYRSEVRTATGRLDALLETGEKVYCFEFKLDGGDGGSADAALRQIDEKDYLLPWTGGGKRLFKVGVSFDKEKRNIGEWKWVEAL